MLQTSRGCKKCDSILLKVLFPAPVHVMLSTMFLTCPQLLSKPKFSGVEKIKTIGSTYMAATGLNVTPGPECAQACFNTHAFILTYMHTETSQGLIVLHNKWIYMESHMALNVSSTFDTEQHS